jgi:putative radical SAM enzyme (TIGR03279 family)
VSRPSIVAVAPGSPADVAGVEPGDEIVTIQGESVRDVIRWRLLADDQDPELVVRRGGIERELQILKPAGVPLGVEVSSALFDQLRTCDNHCPFCFIYQLPAGMRPSLYQKDDDYRLSFLYGNFTTLTRFTEADLERVVTEGLSPLNVSIHATDPGVRNALLRNRRGGPSLRWLGALLDHGVTVHGQLVVCPGLNDGEVLEATLADVLDRYPGLASLHAVPLGLSKFNREPSLRLHTTEEAAAVLDTVEAWQEIYRSTLGRRLVFAADEYYLMAGRLFPPGDAYEGFPQHENGVGMVRTLELELSGRAPAPTSVADGFFAWVDGREGRSGAGGSGGGGAGAGSPLSGAVAAGAPAEGYRAPRTVSLVGRLAEAVGLDSGVGASSVGPDAPVAILTGAYGATVLAELLPPVLAALGRDDVRIVPVRNEFFGGNTAVTGLLVGADLQRVLASEPEGHRYLLPDVCLSRGVFLDGTSPDDLPRPVEVVRTDGIALVEALRVGAPTSATRGSDGRVQESETLSVGVAG